MTTCPSEAMLRSIGTEALGDGTYASLEAHVEQCVDCQQRLEVATKAEPRAANSVPAPIPLPAFPGLDIERVLGRGGSSVVYLAWEPELKRHVAVKLMPRNTAVDPHAREHWLSEARALSRVPHDRVVAIHQVGESEHWLWLVIEYVPGGTLKDRLAEPLAPRDAARLMETIARTVGYFHTRGVTHLDLKPSNILLDGEPGAPWETVSPKISDFGIARLEGEPGTTETGAGGPKGTPAYMAPEQVNALPGTIGPAVDIHALGALLYHLLTGSPPYRGASTADTLDQVRKQEPVAPRRLNGRIPRDLETICLKCLEKAPCRRYLNADALANDLRLWLDGHAIKARRVSAMGHAWRWCRRHPAVAGLLVTLAMTLTTGIVGLAVLLKQAAAGREQIVEALGRAKAHEQFSASAADQLRSFLRTTIRNGWSATPDRMTAELLSLKAFSNELRNKGIILSSELGRFEAEVGKSLRIFNNVEDSRDLLKRAIADLSHESPGTSEDLNRRISLGDALLHSGQLAEGAGELEDALDCFERSAAIYQAFEPSDLKCSVLTSLYKSLQGLANRFGLMSQKICEDRSRCASRQILHHLLGVELGHSKDATSLGIETLRQLYRQYDLSVVAEREDRRAPQRRERFIAEWLALSVGMFSPFQSSSSAAIQDQSPEAVASALISAIEVRCSKLGLMRSMVGAASWIVAERAAEVGSANRRLGRLDKARDTAARLMAIARRLVQEYPESAYSYRLLTEAYDQIKKNAVRANDYRLVEAALVEAVAAGQRSRALEPQLFELSPNLDKLTVQLAQVKAKRLAAGSVVPK